MKRKLWLLALVAVVLLSAAPVLADGDFYVVAVGGGVGTKITSLPCTINNPGFYYLTGNLSYSGSDIGITVSSDQVTIDLMGFCLNGPGINSDTTAINIPGFKNVEVRNGSLNGWGLGLGDYSESCCNRAFNLRAKNCDVAIDFLGSKGSLVKGCSADGGHTGIRIGRGVATGNAVTNCSSNGIGGSGVFSGNTVNNCKMGIGASGTISGNSVTNCSTWGIYCDGASSIVGNTVVNPTSGTPTGINIGTTDPVLVTQNTVGGPGTHFTPGGGTITVTNTNAGFQ